MAAERAAEVFPRRRSAARFPRREPVSGEFRATGAARAAEAIVRRESDGRRKRRPRASKTRCPTAVVAERRGLVAWRTVAMCNETTIGTKFNVDGRFRRSRSFKRRRPTGDRIFRQEANVLVVYKRAGNHSQPKRICYIS